jgi:hypothetical protein
MRAGLSLPCFSFEGIALLAIWKQFGLLAQSLRFVSQTFFKGLGLFETATLLHSATPFRLRAAGRLPMTAGGRGDKG